MSANYEDLDGQCGVRWSLEGDVKLEGRCKSWCQAWRAMRIMIPCLMGDAKCDSKLKGLYKQDAKLKGRCEARYLHWKAMWSKEKERSGPHGPRRVLGGRCKARREWLEGNTEERGERRWVPWVMKSFYCSFLFSVDRLIYFHNCFVCVTQVFPQRFFECFLAEDYLVDFVTKAFPRKYSEFHFTEDCFVKTRFTKNIPQKLLESRFMKDCFIKLIISCKNLRDEFFSEYLMFG